MIWIMKVSGQKITSNRKYTVDYKIDGTLWILKNLRWYETSFIPIPINHPPTAIGGSQNIKVKATS